MTTRIACAVTAALAAAACSTDAGAPAASVDDTRGVEEVNHPSALTAITGTPTFNSTTGALTVALASSDKLLIVSRRAVDNAILLNGKPVTDSAGVNAVATGATGLLKTLGITVAADSSTIVLDFLNGYFAPGVTGTFTASAPIVQGITVDFGAHASCSFKIRATSGNDTVYFGKDKNGNKLISFNNGNFGDVFIKASATVAYGISLGSGNDVFNASPAASVLGGLFTASWTDPITVHGGLGDDTITGGKGADTIYGDEGNNFIDESAYADPAVAVASSTRSLTFNSAKTITASSGSFVTDGFTAGSSIIVTGTTANGTVAAPKTFTIASGGVTATVITVNEAVATEAAYTSAATVTQNSTVHAKDSVFGIVASAPNAGTTTVSYAARPYARSGAGVVVKIGHDTATPPAFLTGTEDNLDETVAVVIGTDFNDVMWCSDTTDAACTMIGGKGDDQLKAGKSTNSMHKLYGGDGADTLIVTNNTDKALLVGGNWTDSAHAAVPFTATAQRSFTFNTNKTITASSGDFAADGFVVGNSISVSGTVANGTNAVPKTFTLAGVATTVLTVVEAVTTEAAYTSGATITQPAVVAPRNLWVDTVDYSALTAAAVTIDVNFPLPTAPKGYTAATPYSGASAKKHTNITKDISRIICPQQSAMQACTFNGNNLGNYVVAGKGADVLTGGTGDDTFDLSAVDSTVIGPNGKVVTGGGGIDAVDFSGRSADTAVDLACANSSCQTSGTDRFDPGVTVTASSTRTLAFDSVAQTVTAAGSAPGSFILDGFAPGQMVTIAGTSGNNDGHFTIASATATVLTLVEAMTADTTTYASAASLTRAPADTVGSTITASASRTLTFDVGKTITASSGDFVADGYWVGQGITVSGTTANNGGYTIASVTATVITVNEALVTESAYSATAKILRAPVTSKILEGTSLVGITNATCPASNATISCFMNGSSADNTMDFNGDIGTVACNGGSDLILNAAPAVDTHCGL